MQESQPERERWENLEAAVRDAVESRQEPPRDSHRGHRSAEATRRQMVLLLLLLWAMIGWIWSTKPAFLFGAPTVITETPAEEEATLRFALYLERNRIDAYVRRNGQLPPSLEAAGPVETGVSLVRTSDGYELLGRRGATQLQLGSAMSADSFLAGSLSRLRQP